MSNDAGSVSALPWCYQRVPATVKLAALVVTSTPPTMAVDGALAVRMFETPPTPIAGDRL
jgi:hypothetical protein